MQLDDRRRDHAQGAQERLLSYVGGTSGRSPDLGRWSKSQIWGCEAEDANRLDGCGGRAIRLVVRVLDDPMRQRAAPGVAVCALHYMRKVVEEPGKWLTGPVMRRRWANG